MQPTAPTEVKQTSQPRDPAGYVIEHGSIQYPTSSPYDPSGITQFAPPPSHPQEPIPVPAPKQKRARRQREATAQKPAPVQTPAQVAVSEHLNSLQMFLGFLEKQAKRRRKRNLQHMIEHRLETPVFLAVTLTMVLRASQLFSGGTLVLSQLLGPYYPLFQMGTGIGLAFGSEMLMTIAGRSWRVWANEATEIQAKPGMSKAARQSYVNQAKTNAIWSQRMMFVGMFSSLFAGLAFLFINGDVQLTALNKITPSQLGQIIVDLVVCTVVTCAVFYLGVLKESRATTDAEDAIAELDESMNDAVKAAIHRFRDGKHTQADERLIAASLSPAKRQKFLQAVVKTDQQKCWTSGELRKRLGIGNDATQIRKLNRRIVELSADTDNGLEKAPNGKNWLIPLPIIFSEWGEQIAERDADIVVAKRLAAMQQSETTEATVQSA